MSELKTILLVEDDEDLSNLYRISLEKSGFQVLIARDGFEGISASLHEAPDLILLDMMMPMSDGKDVLSMVRLHEKSKETPVIVISNLDPGTVDLTGLDGQVIEYWVKSELTPNTLTEKLLDYFS